MSEDAVLLVRPAVAEDVEGMLRLARLGGDGLTNLPPDRDALAARIAGSVATLAGELERAGEQQVRLVMEQAGRIVGVAALWPCVGTERPFYSYQISELSHVSRSTGRRVTHRMLSLVSSMTGASEVGGLLLDPALRRRGAGKLLARSRYLFIARHREMFAARVFAELRGYQDASGASPFWEAVGRHFYDMDFIEADRLSGIPGHPLIEELMPKYPIYINMLPPAAQEAINRPHDDGRAALAMLEAEGFVSGDHVDIFDAGPTVACPTARIESVARARALPLAQGVSAGGAADDTRMMLVAGGRLAGFRCVLAPAVVLPDALWLAPDARAVLGEAGGEDVSFVPLAMDNISAAAAP